MAAAQAYDVIGRTYASTRQSDPRISRLIQDALGHCQTVLNVGAGTGSYETACRGVVAVEPSETMRRARPWGSAPCVAANAEALPFHDRSFQAATAFLTIHHWTDWRAGLGELRRVASDRVVVLHYDLAVMRRVWLADYFPEIFEFDAERSPSLRAVCDDLATEGDVAVEVITVPVPHDCRDGFGTAYWRRPAAYLNPAVRAGISMFAQNSRSSDGGLARLRTDLAERRWQARYSDLLDRTELDCGYRLIVGRRSKGPR